MNEIINAKGNRYNKTRSKYDDMKRASSLAIGMAAVEQRIKPIGPSCFNYIFIEPNRRRDPDNFIAGGHKLIKDALQDVGLLPNDNWKYNLGMRDYWYVDKTCPGVLLCICERLIGEDEAMFYAHGSDGLEMEPNDVCGD